MERKKVPQRSILLIDDDPKVLDSYRLILDQFRLFTARDPREALKVFSGNSIELVLLDLNLYAEGDGFEVLKQIKVLEPWVPVVIVTASNAPGNIVKGMKMGALDYVTKPFNPEELVVMVKRALEHFEHARQVEGLQAQIESASGDQPMIGVSNEMQKVFGVIKKVAPTDSTILIWGESGTGKELVARSIHRNSFRKDKPFIAVNCAGIPDNLMEMEFFGYERGAFTGAEEQKRGKFELAHGGTLFLDEIASLKWDLQGKILRAIQEKCIERVGGNKLIPADVRIVSASNVDLKKMVAEQKFREDLFYRLNVIPVQLPPLRERREDVQLLLRHFVDKTGKKLGRRDILFTTEAQKVLSDYHWPGNVRELENVIERIIVLSDEHRNTIGPDDLPYEIFAGKSRNALNEIIRESPQLKDATVAFEKEFIVRTLEKNQWNRTESARELGVHRNTLLSKMENFGIAKKSLRSRPVIL